MRNFYETLFYRTMSNIRDKPVLFMKMVLLYLILFEVIIIINSVTINFVPQLTEYAVSKLIVAQDELMFRSLLMGFYLVYFLILILAYSLFTMVLFGYVKSFSDKHKHSVKIFGRMFTLNIVLTLLFLLVSVTIMPGVLGIVTTNGWVTGVLVVLIVLLFFLYYAFFNFSQVLFVLNFKFVDNIKRSLRAVFSRAYSGVILLTCIIFAALFIMYLIAGAIFGNFSSNYGLFLNISTYIALIIMSLVLSFNNLYFYMIVTRRVLKPTLRTNALKKSIRKSGSP